MNFFHCLDQNPDLPLLISADRTISRRDAKRRASQYAVVLEEAGAKAGDRILSTLGGWQTDELLLARLGAAFIGAALIPFWPERHEGADFAAKCDSAAAAYGAKLLLRNLAPVDLDKPHAVADGNPVIFHKFSSGTTADPKEFAMTREQIDLKVRDEIANHACKPGDCHFHLVISGQRAKLTPDPVSFFTGAISGVSYGMPPAGLMDAAQTLATIEAISARTPGVLQLTMLWGPKEGVWPPYFIGEFAANATLEQLQKVSLITTAPALSLIQAAALEQKLANGVYIGQWGMKESTLKLFGSPADPIEKRVNTVGKLSAKDGRFVVAGDELCVLSRYVSREFKGRSDDRFDEHGWYHTGDKFALDGDGYLAYQGRLAA